jgi:hypothetical protein
MDQSTSCITADADNTADSTADMAADMAGDMSMDRTVAASDDRATVVCLLAAAQLAVSESELARFVRVYPVLRAQADGLYSDEFANEDVALGFDPALGFS